jgi:hypothetical protein
MSDDSHGSDAEGSHDGDTEAESGGEGEAPAPVAEFVDAAEQIYYEYNEGYLDPDAALSRLGDHVADLRDAYED